MKGAQVVTGPLDRAPAPADRSSQRMDRLLAFGIGTAWALLLSFSTWMALSPWPDVLFRHDFVSFWTAASLFREGSGTSIFDLGTQLAFQRGLRQELATGDEIRFAAGFNPYPYLAILAIPYVPLTLLPFPAAYVLWWGVSLAIFAIAIALPLRNRRFGRTFAVVMLSTGAVTSSLLEGQAYAVLLLPLSHALVLLASGRRILGGAILGFLWVKPQYAVLFALVFLVRMRWRELASMLTTAIGLAAASTAMVGVAGSVQYLSMLREIGSYDYPAVHPEAMVNWRAVLTHLLPNLSEPAGSALVLLLGAATAGAALLAWRGKWDPASPRFQLQVLALLVAAVLRSRQRIVSRSAGSGLAWVQRTRSEEREAIP